MSKFATYFGRFLILVIVVILTVLAFGCSYKPVHFIPVDMPEWEVRLRGEHEADSIIRYAQADSARHHLTMRTVPPSQQFYGHVFMTCFIVASLVIFLVE